MNCIDKVLTDEEIDNLVNEIMNIPIEKNNNCLSTYGSVNVDELISVVKEMQKIPTYDNLLKENEKLKKQLKIKHDGFMASIEEKCELAKENEKLKKQLEEINNFINKANFANIEQLMLDYCAKTEEQKEFIDWLENLVISDLGVFTEIKVCDVLSKYKEIIGDKE